MKTIEEALEFLEAQPDVAEYFKVEGIKGVPAISQSCPVARYLSRERDGRRHSVFTRAMEVDEYFETQGVAVLVPDKVFAFIEAFDQDKYPELVEDW